MPPITGYLPLYDLMEEEESKEKAAREKAAVEALDSPGIPAQPGPAAGPEPG